MQISQGELSVQILLSNTEQTSQSPSTKPKPGISISVEPKVEPWSPSDVSVRLEFKNESARDLHVENRLWFTRLQVFVNNESVAYIGPMASLPPPSKEDFHLIKPGEKYTTEPVRLNNYYQIPKNFKGTIKVKYQFGPQVPIAEQSISLG